LPSAGKSKHEVSASEFECIEEPHQNGHYGNNYLQGNAVADRVEDEEQELDTEGKLPKEFLDTWVCLLFSVSGVTIS